jgi:UDPglucose 6-dehydrogenase
LRICVIGTGYVGLVAAACFADAGHRVTCVDTDVPKIAMLRRGKTPIYEPGLEALVRRNSSRGRLRFSTRHDAVGDAEVVFIAVGTPPRQDGSADLSHVLTAARQVARAVKGYTVVALKSTAPVGTNEKVTELIARETRAEVDVVTNPEFLREGSAIEDFIAPDRVVIGAASDRARKIMLALYAPFLRGEKPVFFMDDRSAELAKHAANSMLATRISFMNELASLCERVGADVDRVREAIGADRRIGDQFLSAGVGYGGSCFPKDVSALISTGRKHGLELEILKAVERTNQRQKGVLVRKALRHFRSLAGRSFAVWGLSFKPGTDDIREAPALEVIEGLTAYGARVRCHDPVAEPTAVRHFRKPGAQLAYADTPYDCVEGAEALFVMTEWSQFRRADLARVRQLMRTPVVFDGRNVFNPETMREMGFVYYGIGRPSPRAAGAGLGGGRSRAAARPAQGAAARRTASAGSAGPGSPRGNRASSSRGHGSRPPGSPAPRRRRRARGQP